MNSVVTFTLVAALYASAVDGDTTDKEEKFIADELTKAVDALAKQPGDLKPKTFDHEVKNLLNSVEVKGKSKEMIEKALKLEWKKEHNLQGINQMVSPTLASEITLKLGKMDKANAELTKDEDFKRRYVTASQYMNEVLNDQLNVIESDLLKS